MKLNELLNYIPEWQRVAITAFGDLIIEVVKE